MFNIYSSSNERTSPIIANAFHEATGFNIYKDNVERAGDWLGFGSPYNWNTLQYAIDREFNYTYADHAYFGRYEYYRVTKNAFFHNGVGETNHQRLRRFYKRENKWIKGSNIILCPQSEGYFERNGMNQADWINECVKNIKINTDRKIIIHKKFEPTPLKSLLNNAWLVVSHTSNAGLEALMHGVPSICTGRTHYEILTTSDFKDIECPYFPENRFDVAGVLADNQYTVDEIKKVEFLNGIT